MNIQLQSTAIEQVYTDVELLINGIVWKFFKRYGGNKDDWQSEANFYFMKAYDKYDKNKGAFTTWLHHCVYRGLQTYYRKTYLGNRPHSISGDTLALLPNKKNPFYTFIDLLDELQKDSKTVVRLIFDMPKELTQEYTEPGDSPKHMKVTLKKHLLKLGWTHARVKESFKEIGEALYA